MSDPTNPFQNRNELKDHFEVERLRAELAAERNELANVRDERDQLDAVLTGLRAELAAVRAAVKQEVILKCEADGAFREALRQKEQARADLAAAKDRVAYLEAYEIIAASRCRERIYEAIRAWTDAPDTVSSRATEAIIRIVNDSLPRGVEGRRG